MRHARHLCRPIFWIAAGIFLCLRATAAPGPQASSPRIQAPLGILADPGGQLTIAQATAGAYKPLMPDQNLAGTVRAYWVRVVVEPPPNAQDQYVLVMAPEWDSAQLYAPRAGGFDQIVSGADVPPARRPVASSMIAFPVLLDPQQASLFYIRVEDELAPPDTAQHIAVRIVNRTNFASEQRRFNYLQGIYAGIILAMFGYNFVLFFSLREKTYFFYSVYVLSFGALWMLRGGFLFDVLWPNSPVWNADSSFYLVGIAVAASALFVRSFFDAPELSATLERTLWGIAGLTVALMAGTVFLSPQQLAPILAFVALIASLFYGVLGFLMLVRGHRRARYFLLAWLTLIAANVIYILVYFGVYHATAGSAHDAVQVGSAIECILLAFALADRVKDIKTESEKRQLQHTAELEDAVEQRTRELVSLNAKLEAASVTDPLTGLSNRRMVDIAMGRLTTEMVRALHDGDTGSLLIGISDLDHFKRINDNFGHEAGDSVLKDVAAVLSRSVRGGTILARWGGEEFLLVERLRNRNEDAAVAERVRQIIEAEVITPGLAGQTRMTMSLGLAHFPFSTTYPELLSWQEVLILADRCLYQAKQAGRNCWFLVRVNEDALDAYVSSFGTASAAALCRTRFDEAVEAGVVEVISAQAAISE